MIEIKRKPRQTPVEAATQPVDGLVNIQTDKYSPATQTPVERKIEAFTGIDPKRSYRAMYRAACNFHEQHCPPQYDPDNEEVQLTYWMKTVEDMGKVAKQFNNDPFCDGLLSEIYKELEREFILLQVKYKKEGKRNAIQRCGTQKQIQGNMRADEVS